MEREISTWDTKRFPEPKTLIASRKNYLHAPRGFPYLNHRGNPSIIRVYLTWFQGRVGRSFSGENIFGNPGRFLRTANKARSRRRSRKNDHPSTGDGRRGVSLWSPVLARQMSWNGHQSWENLGATPLLGMGIAIPT
jgi:hypothetical protein